MKKNITTSIQSCCAGDERKFREIFTTHTIFLIPLIAVVSLISTAGVAIPALAQTPSGTPPADRQIIQDAKQAERMKKIITRADQEIDRRIAVLNKLKMRVEEIKHISDAGKNILSSIVQTQIADLNSLKAKIDADTDIETLRTDVKSITAQYRIFMLVIPQGHILAAADRITGIASQITEISAKLQMRITFAKSAGKDTASLEVALADLNAKIADALAQAKAAENGITSLVPDNGDATQMKNNKASLADSRAKIKIGMQDIAAARKGIYTIMTGIKKFKIDPSLSPLPSISATPTP